MNEKNDKLYCAALFHDTVVQVAESTVNQNRNFTPHTSCTTHTTHITLAHYTALHCSILHHTHRDL